MQLLNDPIVLNSEKGKTLKWKDTMTPTLKIIRLSLMSSIVTFMVALTLTTSPVKADDTEVYVTAGGTNNVLFIFDLSGSMTDLVIVGNCGLSGTCKTRYETMLDAFTNVLDNLKDKSNLRIGLTMYGEDHLDVLNGPPWPNATGIRWPIRDITADAVTTDPLITQNHPVTGAPYKTHEIILNQLQEAGTNLNGATAIVDALYEATLYFQGDNVNKGSGALAAPVWNGMGAGTGYSDGTGPADWTPDNGNGWAANPVTYSGANVNSANYISPITASDSSSPNVTCDKNHIVMLTDGAPTTFMKRTEVAGLIGGAANRCQDLGETFTNVTRFGVCGQEFVEYLATTNQSTITPSTITTHTIGFEAGSSGNAYLQSLAHKGGGQFHPASSAASLEASFTAILETIAGENESFSGFSTSINAGSLSSGNRIFMNMFKPSNANSWIGNTKGYFIASEGLKDLTDTAAIDPATGQFYDTARSFWSSSDDGNEVDQGGLSGKLNSASRNIFTFTGVAGTDSTSPAAANLTKELALSDGNFQASWFGAANDADKDAMITWLKDQPMGDPVHANTIMLSYPGKKVLFTMTNQGLMHAFDVTNPTIAGDSTGGMELSAFIPQSLLANIKSQKNNSASGHIYGLDGSITYWHDDTDDDGVVDSGETALLYF